MANAPRYLTAANAISLLLLFHTMAACVVVYHQSDLISSCHATSTAVSLFASPDFSTLVD